MMKKNEIELKSEAQTFSRRGALRLFGGAGLGVLLANSAQPAAAQTKTAVVNSAQKENLQGAGFYRFKVGDLECCVVSDGVLRLKPVEFFINPLTEVEKALRDAFLPTEEITLQINTLVVKNGKTVALMDTGIGNYIGESGGHLLKNLTRAGFSPNEITDVFLSHGHFDHISGNYNQQNTLNFPNAAFHLSEIEWTTAMDEKKFFGELKPDEQLKKTILDAIKKNLAPLKDRVKLFKANASILPGIRAVTAYGHTPGHSTYVIESGSDSLVYVGDLIHHVIQLANPQIQMNGNSFLKISADSRQKVLREIATQKRKMMAAHFPFPGVGNIRQRNNKEQGFDWIPIEWQW